MDFFSVCTCVIVSLLPLRSGVCENQVREFQCQSTFDFSCHVFLCLSVCALDMVCSLLMIFLLPGLCPLEGNGFLVYSFIFKVSVVISCIMLKV